MAMFYPLGPAFCPDKKTPFFVHCCALISSPPATADHVVERYLVTHGGKMTDDAERQIERLIFRSGR